MVRKSWLVRRVDIAAAAVELSLRADSTLALRILYAAEGIIELAQTEPIQHKHYDSIQRGVLRDEDMAMAKVVSPNGTLDNWCKGGAWHSSFI